MTAVSPAQNDADLKRSLIDELIGVIATGSAQRRLHVVQSITDLFVAGSRRFSNDQIGLFDDLLQKLSAEIEVKARSALAQRLAKLDNAPPKLIRTLAFDDAIAVAEPVLINSSQLSDDDLVENATTQSQDHLYAIAQRLKLSEAVTDALVEHGNRRVVHQVAGNPGARFSLAGYGKLTARARYDRKLAMTIGQRSDIPRQYFLKLLETASASVRTKLEEANPQAAAAIRETVGDIAVAIQHETRESSRAFAIATRDSNRRFKGHTISESNVHAPAAAQEFEKTVLALARLGRFPLDLVERALLDEGEDMVLLLARAAGCSWATARQLLLMDAAKRDMKSEGLFRASERYERLSISTARRVVAFHERRARRRAEMANRAAATGSGTKETAAATPGIATSPPQNADHIVPDAVAVNAQASR